MTFKHLLKIYVKQVESHDMVVSLRYIIKNMLPCECFHLGSDISLKWKDHASIKAIIEVENNYDIVLH
jgi:hypothetical protein